MNDMTDLPKIPMCDSDYEVQIAYIASAQGRHEKEDALRVFAASEDGKRIIDWCYNPFITFGVKRKAEPVFLSNDQFDDWNQLPLVHNLLTSLASRDLTGNAAKEAIESAFACLNPSAAKILWLCLNKDLKAGVAEASLKAIDPKMVPIFAVMRAHLYEEKLVKQFPVVLEPKLDGNRVSFISRDGSGGFFTRTGKVIASLDHMVPDVLKMLKGWFDQTVILNSTDPLNTFLSSLTSKNGIPNIMLDGEMMSDKGFDEVNGALNRKTDVHGLSYHIFDCLSWEEFDAMGAVNVIYLQRRKRVNSVVGYASGMGLAKTIRQTPIRLCNSHEEIQQVYAEHRMLGEEGTMVKNPNGFYEKKKSSEWLKLKNEDTEDLMVVGLFQGQAGGKYADTAGGLIVDRNGVEVRVSGIPDVTRATIWSLWKMTSNVGGFDANVGYAGKSFKVHGAGLLLGRLIEVEFHEVTKDGSLRHPRFIRFRDDKTGEVDK